MSCPTVSWANIQFYGPLKDKIKVTYGPNIFLHSGHRVRLFERAPGIPVNWYRIAHKWRVAIDRQAIFLTVRPKLGFLYFATVTSWCKDCDYSAPYPTGEIQKFP